ncbi:MAG: NAD(P)/FAD-dependent oxidoreductase [Caldilineaceae bacterium]
MDLNLGMGLPGGGQPEAYDVIIIGGGPAGTSAAIYTSRSNLRTLVIDKGLTAGALGVTAKISNYPGIVGPISGAELVATMRTQAESFGAEFITDKVVGVDLSGEPKQVMAGTGTFTAKAVILATGAMGRTSQVAGEEVFLGRGVSYCATCDGAFFRDKPVAVVGNNDEAAEEALFLSKYTNQIHMIVPTPRLNVREEVREALEATSAINLLLGTALREVVGNGKVNGVRVKPRTGEEHVLPVEGAFIYLQGATPITDYILGQVESTPEGCLVVNHELETTLPGVFAVGDLVCSHIKQAVIAASDGVIAAIAADKHINGREKHRTDWK